MSLPLFAVWGAVAGLLLSLPMFVGNLDLGSGLGNAAIVGGVGLMSAGCDRWFAGATWDGRGTDFVFTDQIGFHVGVVVKFG